MSDELEPVSRPACSAEAERIINARGDMCHEEGHTPRERVALAIFIVLLAVGLMILISYISAGHGLNAAATSIDDIAGDMSGYEVILYEGTVTPESEEESSSGIGFVSDVIGLLGGEESDEEAVDHDAASASSGDADDASRAGTGTGSAVIGESDAAEKGSAASGSSSAKGAMTMDEASDVYEEKNASVITVDYDDVHRYVNGRVIMQGSHSYGIFVLPEDVLAALSVPKKTTTKTTTVTTDGEEESTEGPKTTTRVKSAYESVSELFADVDVDAIDPALIERIEMILERFEQAGVDTVIAFTRDPTPFAAIEGVDVVVTLKEHDRFSRSETINGTLYVDAPEKGSVGALLVAPGNVVSVRTLSGDGE